MSDRRQGRVVVALLICLALVSSEQSKYGEADIIINYELLLCLY